MEMLLEWSSKATVDGDLNWLWCGHNASANVRVLTVCKTLALFILCPYNKRHVTTVRVMFFLFFFKLDTNDFAYFGAVETICEHNSDILSALSWHGIHLVSHFRPPCNQSVKSDLSILMTLFSVNVVAAAAVARRHSLRGFYGNWTNMPI